MDTLVVNRRRRQKLEFDTLILQRRGFLCKLRCAYVGASIVCFLYRGIKLVTSPAVGNPISLGQKLNLACQRCIACLSVYGLSMFLSGPVLFFLRLLLTLLVAYLIVEHLGSV